MKIGQRVLIWIGAWVALSEAMAVVLSFTLYYPNWHMNFLCWKIRRSIAMRIK